MNLNIVTYGHLDDTTGAESNVFPCCFYTFEEPDHLPRLHLCALGTRTLPSTSICTVNYPFKLHYRLHPPPPPRPSSGRRRSSGASEPDSRAADVGSVRSGAAELQASLRPNTVAVTSRWVGRRRWIGWSCVEASWRGYVPPPPASPWQAGGSPAPATLASPRS